MNNFNMFNKLYEEVATFLTKDNKLKIDNNSIQEECCDVAVPAGINVRRRNAVQVHLKHQ